MSFKIQLKIEYLLPYTGSRKVLENIPARVRKLHKRTLESIATTRYHIEQGEREYDEIKHHYIKFIELKITTVVPASHSMTSLR